MLLQIRELGTRENERHYHIQTPHGLTGIIALGEAHVNYGQDPLVWITLVGTSYQRAYPASAELGQAAPRILDLAGGYQTVSAFVACWEYSTPEQRDIIQMEDKRKRKWKPHITEDRPRLIPGTERADGWIAVYVKDLRAALKKAKGAIRLGSVTLGATTLRKLLSTKGALSSGVLELRPDENWIPGALTIRSTDGRAQVTIKHGAGDKYKGRAGFTRRLAFERV